jgi:LPS-assembly protein
MPWVRTVACLMCLGSGIEAHAQPQPSPDVPQETAAASQSQAPANALEDLPPCSQLKMTQDSAGPRRLTGNVECELSDGTKVFAEIMEIYRDVATNRIVATGNVVFSGPEGHISAERLEYDTATGTGTFHIASGILALPADRSRSPFGGKPPSLYFHGQKIEKLGPRRYRVTRGEWSTCEQPTPRWDFTSGTMVLNLEDYVVSSNTVLRLKGVPMMYLPWMYYPIQSDDRATGFLMPTYGRSSFRGLAFSNAFFWAIGRSHDATFLHDWFTRAGQGAGMEYRYVTGPQSSGNFRLYEFHRSETESTENGITTVHPAGNSYEITGTAVQTVAPGIIARTRLDYFSDVVNQQLLHQTIYEATRRNRLIEAAVTAAFGRLSSNLLYQRNEVVNGLTDTLVYGSTPRATASLAPQRLFQTPVYASLSADYAFLPYRRYLDGALSRDDSFGRLDASPSVRVPLSRLSFLSVNASAAYRTTYYTRQAGDVTGQTAPGSFLRRYATAKTDIVGPVLTRIWDLPEGAFAERLKHVIEPTIVLDFTSPIVDYRRTPILTDISDFVVGNSARVTYGFTNRLFSRGRMVNGSRGATREFVTVGIQETFYSRPEASRYDTTYVSSQGTGTGRELSPVAMTIRVSPGASIDGNGRIEYDVSGGGLQVLTTGATLNRPEGGVTINYSRQRLNRSQPASSFVSASARAQLLQKSVSMTYNVNWDVARSYIASQGVVASYMAQCCGVQAEYQQANYPTGFGFPVNSDHRLNFSLVLAGLGTFSNFFGAFGG